MSAAATASPSPARAAYNALARSFSRKFKLQHALAILEADAATTMPPGGAPARGAACGELSAIVHAELTSPANVANVAILKKAMENTTAATKQLSSAQQIEDLTDMELSNFAEMRRLVDNETLIPAELVRARSEATMAAETCWRVARAKNDFAMFVPHLATVLGIAKDCTRALKAGRGAEETRSLYEIMMDEHDPRGFTLAETESFFADLKTWLPAALSARIKTQTDKARSFATITDVPLDKQAALAKALARYCNFSFDTGVILTSTHPMTAGVPTDVRLTVRYSADWRGDGCLAAMHEGGHAVAEQGRNPDFLDQPVSAIRGMSIHESQSLLHEMHIGRSLPFAKYLSGLAQKEFGPELAAAMQAELEPDELFARGLHVERGLIRVDADELSYPLHVLVRFEIEKELINGDDLKVSDIPRVWREKYKKYLDVDVESDAAGCLQDVHWSLGAFGYFPSYSFGAAISAQLMHTIRKELGSDNVDAMIEAGDISPIQSILRDRIWRKGSSMSVQEMLVAATGEPFNSKYYKDHLLSRYE